MGKSESDGWSAWKHGTSTWEITVFSGGDAARGFELRNDRIIDVFEKDRWGTMQGEMAGKGAKARQASEIAVKRMSSDGEEREWARTDQG